MPSDAPRGSEWWFATEGDVVNKFERLAGHVLSLHQMASIRDIVLRLEKLPDTSALIHLLTKH